MVYGLRGVSINSYEIAGVVVLYMQVHVCGASNDILFAPNIFGIG